MLSLKFFVQIIPSSIVHTVNIEIREYISRGQKQLEIIKLSGPKSGHGCLQEVVVY